MRHAVGIACAVLSLVGQPGAAQESTVTEDPAPQTPLLTLDNDRLFSGSAFGKTVIARQDEETSALISENRRIEAALEAEEKDLTARRASMSRQDFAPLSDAFNTKVEGIRKAQDAKTRDLQRGFEEDRRRFLEAAKPILAAVMTTRGAVAIIDNRAVFVGFENIDITDEAISRLDAAFAEGRLTPGTP